MSIRIIPQDELGSSEKRTADMIPPLLFPRLKNLYNRRAERLRELAENNPLGDYLRFAALIAHAQEVVLYDHPLEMDLTARIKEASAQGKPPLDIHVLPRDKHWQKLLMALIAELKPEMSGPALAGSTPSGMGRLQPQCARTLSAKPPWRPMMVGWRLAHRFCSPPMQKLQWQQLLACQPTPTRWPTVRPLTWSPTATMVPTISWPGTRG